MCGIYGWVENEQRADESSSANTQLTAMADALHHRGPDARGQFSHENIHLRAIRLAILDPELIRYSCQLSLDQKKDKKPWRDMVKQACPEVDQQIPKVPFYFPVEAFTQNEELWQLVDTYLSEPAVTERNLFNYNAVEKIIEQARGGEFLPIK